MKWPRRKDGSNSWEYAVSADLSKATARPWFANDRFVSTRQNGFGDVAVVQPDHGDAEATAAFIAHAANLHDDLVNALEEISELRVFDLPAESTLTDYDVAISIIRKARGLANMALAKAKGE